MSDDQDLESPEKFKVYENLLRSYQEELEKKTKEALKYKLDYDILLTKYTSLINKKNKENPVDITSLQEELLQKTVHIENLKGTLSSTKESLHKMEKKITLYKIEVEKKENFIKDLLYEKKQIAMNLEEKILELNELSKTSPKKVINNSSNTNIQKEFAVLKDINKTLITLLKWKNVENEQLKTGINNSNQEDFEEKMEKFKAQEQVLLKKLTGQMNEWASFNEDPLEF